MDYGARFYSPSLNRFISPDTIVPSSGNPQSLNRYSYVLNNALKYTDPTGHKEACGVYGASCKESPLPYSGPSIQANTSPSPIVGIVAQFVGAANTAYSALVDTATATKNVGLLNFLTTNKAIRWMAGTKGRVWAVEAGQGPGEVLKWSLRDIKATGKILPFARQGAHVCGLEFGIGDVIGAGITLGADGLPYVLGQQTGLKNFVADAGAGQMGYWGADALGKAVGIPVGETIGTGIGTMFAETGPVAAAWPIAGRFAGELIVAVGAQVAYDAYLRPTVRQWIRGRLGP